MCSKEGRIEISFEPFYGGDEGFNPGKGGFLWEDRALDCSTFLICVGITFGSCWGAKEDYIWVPNWVDEPLWGEKHLPESFFKDFRAPEYFCLPRGGFPNVAKFNVCSPPKEELFRPQYLRG